MQSLPGFFEANDFWPLCKVSIFYCLLVLPTVSGLSSFTKFEEIEPAIAYTNVPFYRGFLSLLLWEGGLLSRSASQRSTGIRLWILN